jgi:hypothetical protein
MAFETAREMELAGIGARLWEEFELVPAPLWSAVS